MLKKNFYTFSLYLFSIKSLTMNIIESHCTQSRADERALCISSLPNLTDENSEVICSC